ncbi:hypothetical protein K0M31_000382, partial [Melipona bicolor]
SFADCDRHNYVACTAGTAAEVPRARSRVLATTTTTTTTTTTITTTTTSDADAERREKRETRGDLLDEFRICAGTWKPTWWQRRARYPRSTSAVDVYSVKTGEGRNDGRWQRRLGLSFAN